MKKIVVLVAVLLIGFGISNAKGAYEFHIGLSAPSGAFVDNNYENAIGDGAGCAAMGLDLGLKYFYPLEAKGLSFTIGIDFMYHELTNDCKDNLGDELRSEYLDLNVVFPSYFNIPIMAGLNYERPVGKDLAFYGEAGVGINISNLTELKMEGVYSGYEVKSVSRFKSLTNLCYKVGGGLVFKNKYTIGLVYNALGSYKFKGNQEILINSESQSREANFNKALDINVLNLTFGVRF